MWIGILGLIPLWLRRPSANMERQRLAAVVCLAWGIPVALAVVYWTRTVEFGEEGRLAHIANAAYALIFVLGWQAWAPRRAQRWVEGAIVLFMLTLAASLIPFLYTSYRLPVALAAPPTPDRPLNVHFDGGMQLLGLDLPAGAGVRPGQPLPVTLYWTTTKPITDFYTLFIHLADADNNLLYQFDGVPVGRTSPNGPMAPWGGHCRHLSNRCNRRANRRTGQLEPGLLPAGRPTSASPPTTRPAMSLGIGCWRRRSGCTQRRRRHRQPSHPWLPGRTASAWLRPASSPTLPVCQPASRSPGRPRNRCRQTIRSSSRRWTKTIASWHKWIASQGMALTRRPRGKPAIRSPIRCCGGRRRQHGDGLSSASTTLLVSACL